MQKMTIYLRSHISKFGCPSQLYDILKLIRITVELIVIVMAKLNMVYLSSLKNQQSCCRPACRCHHLGYSMPLTPAHHYAIWHLRPSLYYVAQAWNVFFIAYLFFLNILLNVKTRLRPEKKFWVIFFQNTKLYTSWESVLQIRNLNILIQVLYLVIMLNFSGEDGVAWIFRDQWHTCEYCLFSMFCHLLK